MAGKAQVFESTLECSDPFKFTYTPIDDVILAFYHYDPSLSSIAPLSVQEKLSPWCYVEPPFSFSAESPLASGNSTSITESPLRSLLNRSQVVLNCTNLAPIEDQDPRVLFAVDLWLSLNESEVSGFMCEPKYSFTRRSVTNITHENGVYDHLHIAEAITETLDIAIRPFNLTKEIVDKWGNGLWLDLLNTTEPQDSVSSFRNTSLTIELSKRVWQGLAAYIIKREYTHPSNQIVNGTAVLTQGRICVQELSLRFLEALISLLLLFSVALSFMRPGSFYRDPTSLGAHAMILARSPGLMALLESYGAVSEQVLQPSLSGILVSYTQRPFPKSLAIAIKKPQNYPENRAEDVTTDEHQLREWWRPISVRWWFRICILTATLGFMIALEVLLQTSTRGNGICNVRLDGYTKYTWTLLPTFLLAVIGLLFSMVDSTARILHPFQLLRKGGASLADILHDYTCQWLLVAVVCATCKRHFALLLAILPGLLAPILTITSSGLYTAVPTPWIYDTELQLKDWFRPRDDDFDTEFDNPGDAWTTFALTEYDIVSYPQWTHGGYALSRFGADNLHSHDGNDTFLDVKARVPATHANFNCTLIGRYTEDDCLTVNHLSTQNKRKWIHIDSQPLGCDTLPEGNYTAGQPNLYLDTSIINHRGESVALGRSQGYDLTPLSSYYGMDLVRDNYTLRGSHSFQTCHYERFGLFIGLASGKEAMTVLHCLPFVEALWVTATFSLPDLSLVADMPVVPELNSSKFLSDSINMTFFSANRLEDTFAMVANGSSRQSHLAGLVPGPDDKHARRLIAFVEGVFSEYLAQRLHTYFRYSLEGTYNDTNSMSSRDPITPDCRPATGTVTDRSRLRLVQNEVSTRVLQGLLGVMALCLVAETIMVRGGRVIPRDPGSIASKMAYFAGGELWQHVPVGADRWSDEEIVKWGRENCNGGLLLDWWGGDEQEASEDEAPQSSERARRFAVDSVNMEGVVSGRRMRQ